MIIVEVLAAYGLISHDSCRVSCDQIVCSGSNNNFGKPSIHSTGASCDLDDHVTRDDLSRFDNLGGVSVTCGDSGMFLRCSW